jgi:hypothetical protein
MTFLRHVVDCTRSQPDPKKIIAINDFLICKTTTNVKVFLGLMGYYRTFNARYAKIAKPLFALTTKEYKFVWTLIC